jgi:hypothetical protein
VGDAARNRIGRGYKRNDVQVLSERSVSDVLERSSLEATTTDTIHIRTLARHMRADEIVWGTVERTNGRLRPAAARPGSASCSRSPRRGTNVDAVGAVRGKRAGRAAQAGPAPALRERPARGRMSCRWPREEGGAAPDGVIMRSCLVSAMIASGADGREVLPEALRLLQLNPESYYGLDAAARAYDAIGDKDKAAEMWVRLAASDSTDEALTRRVVEALLRGATRATPRPHRLGKAARQLRVAALSSRCW